jgi:hypothetical protein
MLRLLRIKYKILWRALWSTWISIPEAFKRFFHKNFYYMLLLLSLSMFSALPRILTSRRIRGIWDSFSQSISFFISLITSVNLLKWKLKSSSFEQIVCYSIHLNSQNYFHIFNAAILVFHNCMNYPRCTGIVDLWMDVIKFIKCGLWWIYLGKVGCLPKVAAVQIFLRNLRPYWLRP